MQTPGLVIQEGACLLLRSSVWGGGRDSSSAGMEVDVFMHKENKIYVSRYP